MCLLLGVVHIVKCVCCWVLFTLSNVSIHIVRTGGCCSVLFTLSDVSVVHPVKCVAQCCSHCQMWLLFTLLFALSSVSFFLFRSHLPKQPQQVCQLQSLHPRCVALWRREWLSRWVWRGKGCWLWWVVAVYSHCLWNIHWWTGCVCNSDWWTDCDCNSGELTVFVTVIGELIVFVTLIGELIVSLIGELIVFVTLVNWLCL